MKSKIWLFGDSIMKGITLDENYKYCINKDFNPVGSKQEMANKSVMGATVKKGLEMFARSQVECNNTVIIEYGGNDCNFNWDEVSLYPKNEHLPNVSIEEFYDKYSNMIKTAQKSAKRVFAATLVPLDAEKYFAWICKDRCEENILSWLGDKSMLSRWQETYNSAALLAAKSLDCEVIDLRTPFLLSHNFKQLMCQDGIHPSVEGHKLIEQTIKQAI